MIIYHDFFSPPRSCTHVKSDTKHTIINIHPLAHILNISALIFNNCTIIIIGVYRPPDKSKNPEFKIKLNEILSSTSQSDHVFIVGNVNINLLDQGSERLILRQLS